MATTSTDMGWDTAVALILQYGLPFAEKMWTKWASGNPPTAADWAELNALAASSARTRMMQILAQNNIDPASEKGKALLALVP